MVVLRWVMISLVLKFSAPAHADFAAGQAAYDRGDFNAAYNEWLPLAEAGDAEAQFRVGRLYDVGEGRPADWPKAVKWYEKAFEQGNVKAAFNLALRYEFGDGVPKNYEKAYVYYRYAAERNFARSQVSLSYFYFTGRAAKKNYSEGFKWLFIAKNRGAGNTEKIIKEVLEYVPNHHMQQGEILAREWLKNHPRNIDE